MFDCQIDKSLIWMNFSIIQKRPRTIERRLFDTEESDNAFNHILFWITMTMVTGWTIWKFECEFSRCGCDTNENYFDNLLSVIVSEFGQFHFEIFHCWTLAVVLVIHSERIGRFIRDVIDFNSIGVINTIYSRCQISIFVCGNWSSHRFNVLWKCFTIPTVF